MLIDVGAPGERRGIFTPRRSSSIVVVVLQKRRTKAKTLVFGPQVLDSRPIHPHALCGTPNSAHIMLIYKFTTPTSHSAYECDEAVLRGLWNIWNIQTICQREGVMAVRGIVIMT